VRYLSVCSGIEAASVAWHPLGCESVAFAEIDAFPSAVLAHHYPSVPNWGDLTRFREWPDAAIDVLVGGTPCQSFSVAGLRAGLADPRGNLALTYLAVADRYRPTWLVWENVPGVLSADTGRAFGAFLGGLAQLGYGFAYRVLDAQYFELAQRRARVFVVGHLGDWRRAAAVLFERESLSGHPAPCREAGEVVTAGTLRSTDGGLDCDHAAAGHLVAHSLRADGFDASEDGTGRGTPIVPTGYSETGQGWWTEGLAGLRADPGGMPENIVAFSAKDHGADAGELAPTLRAGGFTNSHANGGVMPAVAFDTTQITSKANRSNPKPGDPCHPLAAGAHAPAVAFNWQSGGDARGLQAQAQAQALSCHQTPAMQSGMQVRRLTPRECERLQGFPDDYTLIPYRGKLAADGPRYKALGNSMAVPVMAWIGRRMQMVEQLDV